ncbi:hypothetical protein FRB99_005903 [Tulasnella sp. 403]|nr:hypothetical protein FRB99_005903 [Tulasnella sp. 403]
MDHPRTPSPQPGPSDSRPNPLTPEQTKRIEINRLKAKARLRATIEANNANPISLRNANNKRPLSVVPVTNTSPTVPGQSAGSVTTSAPPKVPSSVTASTAPEPLKRDAKLMGRYLDYDLSKMVDSRGGFLIEDPSGEDESERRRLLARERERMKQVLDPPMYMDPSMNPRCAECQSISIDHTFKNIFGCLVCNECKEKHPEKYSLLTKTECKEDYLLTDPELRDQELLPHLLRPNPHKATWNNMMLFLRYQVEEFAWKKWGSPEALDAEYERRTEEKRKKKSKKFEDGLRDLRKKTREGVWQRRKDEEHVHEFGEVERVEEADGDQMQGSSSGKQRCKECGFEIEVEVF